MLHWSRVECSPFIWTNCRHTCFSWFLKLATQLAGETGSQRLVRIVSPVMVLLGWVFSVGLFKNPESLVAAFSCHPRSQLAFAVFLLQLWCTLSPTVQWAE
jgi:hypothetical protein